jgi:hypothetical protein
MDQNRSDSSFGSRNGCLILGTALLIAGCGEDTRPAAWEYISPVIMQPNCATSSCHSRAAAVSGLDFSDVERGYTSLMHLKVWVVDPSGADGCMLKSGTVVCQRNFRPLVNPYNPEQSRLVNMLRARNAERMPPDRPLPEADIQLVERWIRNGAPMHQPREDAGAIDARVGGDGGDGPRVTVTVTLPDGRVITIEDDASAADGPASDAAPGDAAGKDGAATDGSGKDGSSAESGDGGGGGGGDSIDAGFPADLQLVDANPVAN